jgi:drug/metabolite transporter (DMT)-like permease
MHRARADAMFIQRCSAASRPDALTVTGIEMRAGVVRLSVIALALPASQSPYVLPATHDVLRFLVLAIVSTILPFALWLAALRQLSAHSTTLAVNLEPVDGSVLARFANSAKSTENID